LFAITKCGIINKTDEEEEKMFSKYRGLCKGLSIAVLVFGIIGSIILAGTYGEIKEVSHSLYSGVITSTKRNVALTFGIFVSGIFSTGILYVILAGLSEALEYLEMLSKRDYKYDTNLLQKSELPPL